MSDKKVCFVLMPIADTPGYEPGHFSRVYEHLLKPAITAAGYTPVRADDAVKTDYIVVGIIQRIIESDMVLCDFSARNPNVMYELGVRHAFNKPVVLVKDKKTDRIFDIQGLRYTEYDESLRIDAVNKDNSKIAASIQETASATNKDLNSIVHLAGIKAAQVPAGQTVSPDTKLLLSAIGAIDRRLQSVEGQMAQSDEVEPNFLVYDDKIVFKNGDKAAVGDVLFINGDPFGELVGLDVQRQLIAVKRERGGIVQISSIDPRGKEIDSVPF